MGLIGRADPADAPTLAALHAAAMADGWSAQSIADLIDAPGGLCFWAAGQGFVLARAIADEAEVLMLAVAPAVRRAGLGRALLGEALAALRALGVRLVHLEVARGNGPARGLYAAAGFAETGVRRAYYPDGDDAITLALRLDSAAAAPHT
jgi:ribosomal-protein-alanine N-acetyltransferase